VQFLPGPGFVSWLTLPWILS